MLLKFESTRSKKKKYFVAQKLKELGPKKKYFLRHLKSRSVIFVLDKFPVFRFRISGAVFLGAREAFLAKKERLYIQFFFNERFARLVA